MIKKTLFVTIIFYSFLIEAQEKNNISIDPFLPVFGTIQMQYERGISENMSISLSVGLKRTSGIFKLRGLDTNKVITDDLNFKGFKIIPEYRWYIQHRGLSGFYVGAYLKYQDYIEDVDGTYTDNTLQDYKIGLEGEIKTIAMGLQVGYKLDFKKRFFIDFIIAGPGVSFNVFELKEKTPIPQGFYDDLSEAISNYGFFEHLNTSFNINANQKSETKVLPAFRYGIKLGYRF